MMNKWRLWIHWHYYHKYTDYHDYHFLKEVLLFMIIVVFVLCCVVFVQAMVQYNRLELLTHPVCQKYLEMKW